MIALLYRLIAPPPPPPAAVLHFRTTPLLDPDAYRAGFEAVRAALPRREAEAARADLARRAVGVEPRDVAMTPLAEWMVGR